MPSCAHTKVLLYSAFTASSTHGPVVDQEYEKLKASDPDFYRAADSMSYGGAGKVPDANIDKMVAELNERYHSQSLIYPLPSCCSLGSPFVFCSCTFACVCSVVLHQCMHYFVQNSRAHLAERSCKIRQD